MNKQALLKRLRNRYVIVTIVMAAIYFFIDKDNYFAVDAKQDEVKRLEEVRTKKEARLERIQADLDDLDDNPERIEKIARERYQMKRKTEDIYVIKSETENQADD